MEPISIAWNAKKFLRRQNTLDNIWIFTSVTKALGVQSAMKGSEQLLTSSNILIHTRMRKYLTVPNALEVLKRLKA